MVRYILIGIAAGLASALLYLAIITGSPFAAILFYAAPLPIIIVTLGWGTVTGAVAALAGTGAILAGLSGELALFFFALSAAPSAFLGHLCGLWRSADPDDPNAREYYPIGRLIIWTAVLAALAVLLTIPLFGADLEGYRAALKENLRLLFAAGETAAGPIPDGFDTEALLEFLAIALPVVGAVLWMLAELLNLYLAGKIVAASARLRRPWPVLAEIEFPYLATVAFVVAIVVSFIDGIVGFAGSVLTATLGTAFALLGLAVLHAITAGSSARPFILGTVYMLLVLTGWIGVALAALGLAEPFLRLRARLGGRGPGAPS
ncbi:MAG: DUF2232 domain-containing protein [Hyphomicrobiales bacterium]|nr:DUF2232 domain-containing protein [Hyphomicrobiales bacterium]